MGLIADARNIQRLDPAAKSLVEVMLLYPGFHVLISHRIAHWLYRHKRFFLARWVSQIGRGITGIEIHPGAKIGSYCVIGAGAVVTGKMDAPDGSLLLGSPAKIVREVSPEMRAEIEKDAALYVKLAQKQL